jgi:hypothetical protein
MAYYADLTRYTYFASSVPAEVRALNVGWLDPGEPYVVGDVPPAFLQHLRILVRDEPQMKTRGFENCGFPHGGKDVGYPITAQVEEDAVYLGGSEIRVVAATGEWLISPDLVLHYVTAHSYRPPDEFIEAVMSRRVAPEIAPEVDW